MNEKLLQNPSLLPLSRVSGEEAQTIADELLARWNDKFATVSPNSLVQCNYKDYYSGMMDDLSDRGYTYKSMMETGQQAVSDAENTRQQLLGVSSDEELRCSTMYSTTTQTPRCCQTMNSMQRLPRPRRTS